MRGGGKNFLFHMLESVINQSYKNLEIILVNDGSTDNSLDICNDFAKRDDRIVVLSQENRGASAARNKGIEIATGDYIHICDADDELEDGVYAEAMKMAERYEPDVIRFNLATYHGNDRKIDRIIKQPYEVLLDRQYIIEEVVPYTIGIKVQPDKKIDGHWTLITKREILEDNHIRYNENQTKEEDHPFLVNILAYAQSIIFLKGTYYHYLKHPGSLISTYSPRFQNFCNNFALYEYLFGEFYDFSTQTKIEYNINCAIDAMEYVIYHYKDCNCKEEFFKIIDSAEVKRWASVLEPKNEIQQKLKRCIETKRYAWFYRFFLYHIFKTRMQHAYDKVIKKRHLSCA